MSFNIIWTLIISMYVIVYTISTIREYPSIESIPILLLKDIIEFESCLYTQISYKSTNGTNEIHITIKTVEWGDVTFYYTQNSKSSISIFIHNVLYVDVIW